MTNNRVFESIEAIIPKFTDDKNFSNQVVNILGNNFGFHAVSLYLVDENRENAVLAAGFGKFAEILLAHNHKLSFSKKGLVVDVINYGEIQIYKPIHPAPYCLGHEFYKCTPPADMRRDSRLEFQLIREAEITDWRIQNVTTPPFGWEICLPMQFNNIIFGAIDILIQINLDDDEKRFWEGYLLTELNNDVKFSMSDCSGLQWLVSLISSNYKKAKTL